MYSAVLLAGLKLTCSSVSCSSTLELVLCQKEKRPSQWHTLDYKSLSTLISVYFCLAEKNKSDSSAKLVTT